MKSTTLFTMGALPSICVFFHLLKESFGGNSEHTVVYLYLLICVGFYFVNQW